jgi:hypothetical protein
MTHLPTKRWIITLFMLLSLSLLSVFSLRAEESTPEAPPTSENGLPPLIVELDFGPGSFNLPATNIGLADLSSYRATLTRSFKGTKAGQPEEWSQTYVMLANKTPAARQLTIDRLPAANTQVSLTEMNGALYQLVQEGSCLATVIQPESFLAETREPVGFLSSLIGAKEVGSETVNGVASKHYTFDERALGEQDVAASKGEVWVAVDGGYVVKYTLATTGSADYFGEGAEGVLTWDYQLTDVNQPVAITLPTGCPAGMIDAPVLPDAANVVKLPGILRYKTVTSMADVVAFYQTELMALGWQLPAPPSVADDSALMDFIKDNQYIKLILMVADGTTHVRLILSSQP